MTMTGFCSWKRPNATCISGAAATIVTFMTCMHLSSLLTIRAAESWSVHIYADDHGSSGKNACQQSHACLCTQAHKIIIRYEQWPKELKKECKAKLLCVFEKVLSTGQ